tara:strand:- start:3082 stop:3606 length:525 start_codon:yes stop_codon:yes gene_type:complete
MSLLKKFFSKKSIEDLKEQSRSDYETAIKNLHNRPALGLRLRLANRAKVNIEKTFLEAAELTDTYESLKEGYLNRDEPIEALKPPKLIDSYQLISTDNGVVISYIPEDYSEEIFKLGCSYQKCMITADKAKSLAQNVMNKICFELDINKEIDVLEFLERDSEENGYKKIDNKPD